MRGEYLTEVIYTCILLLSVLAIVANILVCLLVLNAKQLRTYVNGFVISLAASDILTSTTLFVYISFNGKPKTELERAFIKYLIFVTTTSEIGNLCAVSYERYLAVVKPLHYKTRVKKYFLRIVTTVWVVSFFSSLLVFLRFTSVRHYNLRITFIASVFIFVLVPFLFMIGLYIRIYVELRRQSKRVNDLRVTQRQPMNLRRNREAKIVKIFSIVAFLYAVSWIPAIAHKSVKEIQHFTLPGSDSNFAIQLFVVGSILSSLANPFIYTFAKQDFRRQIRKISQNIRNKLLSSSTDVVSSFSAPSSSKGVLDTLTLKRLSHSTNRRLSQNK
jgi:hypothetical protein